MFEMIANIVIVCAIGIVMLMVLMIAIAPAMLSSQITREEENNERV